MGRVLIPLLISLLLATAWLGIAPSQADAPATTTPAADIQPIRGPVAVANLPPFALTGGALLLAAGWFLLQRKVRRRKVTIVSSAAVSQPEAGELLARLAEDYRQGVCSGEQLIVCLDDLLRSSLANKTGIAAQQLTSSELLLQAEPFLDDQERGSLNRLLALGDRVKFAAYPPAANEIEGALSAAASLFNGSLSGPA